MPTRVTIADSAGLPRVAAAIADRPTSSGWGWEPKSWRRRYKTDFPRPASSAWTGIRPRRKGATVQILRRLRERKTDILIGTQMVAKGHDYPHITLVGIICADLSLSMPDFRAGERTFQLLAQVAGPSRPGRSPRPGHSPDL